MVPGYEFSGEIIDAGENNKLNFKKGDRVVALKGIKMNQSKQKKISVAFSALEWKSISLLFWLISGHLNCGGGLAGQSIVDENDCWLCNNVSLKDSAILPYGHGTALLAFTKYCEIKGRPLPL